MDWPKYSTCMGEEKSSLFCSFRPWPYLLTQGSWLSSQFTSGWCMRWAGTSSWSKSWSFKIPFIYFSMHPQQSGAISSAPSLALPACCSLGQRSLGWLFPEGCSSVHCNDKRHWLQSFWSNLLEANNEPQIWSDSVCIPNHYLILEKNIYWGDSGCGRNLFLGKKKLKR